MKRRNFIAILGGGVVLAATSAIATFVNTREPTKALAPWQMAGGDAYLETRIRALSYAILAPNPHNRQPWLVDLSVENQVTLFVDTEKLLPHTDPLNRQITIGLGCFLEVMTMAAAEQSYRVEITLFPEGSDAAKLTKAPVARAVFVKDSTVKPDPLFSHVVQRRTLKEPFDLTKSVSRSALKSMIDSGRNGTRIAGSVENESILKLRDLTTKALQIEIDTPQTYKESVDLFRIGKTEIEANPDGIDFSGALFEALALVGQFDREIVLDPNTASYSQGVAAVLENAQTAMGHIWMVTKDNSREAQIAAGRDWVRINLSATALGIGFQPLSQALQEYPEMAEEYKAVHELFAKDGGTVQMLSRLGYGPSVAVSPRWPIEAKIMKV